MITVEEKKKFDRFFDNENPNWSGHSMENVVFIRTVQSHLNDVLRIEGFVTVNDAFKLLGIERTEEGALAGWTKTNNIFFGDLERLGDPIPLYFNINSTNVFRDK